MGANLSIFQKSLLLVGIPLLAQLLFLGVLVEMRAEQANAQWWAIHTKDVIAEAEGLYTDVVEAHSAVRGYALIGDAARAGYDRTAASAPARFERLPGLVVDNPSQQAKANDIVARARTLLAWLAAADRLAREGRRAELLTQIQTLEGQRQLDGLRAEVRLFLAEEERLDRERLAALERTVAAQVWVLAAGGLLSLVVTGVLLWAYARSLVRRISVLRDNSRRLAGGKELSAPLAGADEISQLDRVFHEMATSLAQKDRENEMFVYSVSHDLRSPLVNLQGFSQELSAVAQDVRGLVADAGVPGPVRDRGLKLIDRDMAESVHFIQTAVTRLSGIIDSLLRLSRAGRVEYRWQEVDARAVAVRVAEALRSTLTERDAEVTVGPLPPCWGDPAAVEQVFANLVGNAVNYLDPKRPGRVEVGGGEVGADGLRVYHVRDNGLGIPADHQRKVFVAFQRLHPDAAKGEGIGLALVRRVVERHGGRIWVESEVGVGSTFFVALPSEKPRPAVDAAA